LETRSKAYKERSKANPIGHRTRFMNFWHQSIADLLKPFTVKEFNVEWRK